MSEEKRSIPSAVVTGAGSGIGRACVVRLVGDGVRVACLDRDPSALSELHDAIGDRVLPIPCDVSQEEEVASAVARARQAFGEIDMAVLCAGVYLADRDSGVDSLSLEAWRQTLDVNLTGMFLSAREAVRSMRDGGSIVLIGSPTGFLGMELGMHAYSASKGGVHGLARVMANEYAHRGIRVNLVVPGLIRTGLNANSFRDQPETIASVVRSIPLRRAGEPREVAAMVSWLCSPDASYATGGIFVIDGGLTAI